MLKTKYGDMKNNKKSFFSQLPQKGKDKMKPINSHIEVKAADNSAGKYLEHGLYKKGLIAIDNKINKPIMI